MPCGSQKELTARKEASGTYHPDTLACRHLLAVSLSDLGNKEALHVVREALEARRECKIRARAWADDTILCFATATSLNPKSLPSDKHEGFGVGPRHPGMLNLLWLKSLLHRRLHEGALRRKRATDNPFPTF